MKSEILSIGTEILLGEITDTNAAYIAGQLPLLGIDLYWVTQVGDNQSRIVEALHRAWDRSELIIITGGLGPTEDDLTRESIAEMLGEEMVIDPALTQWLSATFARMNLAMPENNLKQATLISSATALPNPNGTAPGWFVQKEGRIIVAMPGPPWEMKQMWDIEISPKLQKTTGASIIHSRTLKILGLGEARVDQIISPLLSSQNPSIGVYAKPTGIEIRLTAKAKTQTEASGMIRPMEVQIRELLGNHIWGADHDTLEKVIGDLLIEKIVTLATMESCTGGMLSDLITDVPGSSNYFKGGLISYSNEAKISFGVDPQLIEKHGAVSPQVAQAMAQAVRERLSSDIGIGITGVAGPSPLEGKPAGTVYIGITDGKKSELETITFAQNRKQVKRYATMKALLKLRTLLIEKTGPTP